MAALRKEMFSYDETKIPDSYNINDYIIPLMEYQKELTSLDGNIRDGIMKYLIECDMRNANRETWSIVGLVSEDICKCILNNMIYSAKEILTGVAVARLLNTWVSSGDGFHE